jgi:hypothetical protein
MQSNNGNEQPTKFDNTNGRLLAKNEQPTKFDNTDGRLLAKNKTRRSKQ